MPTYESFDWYETPVYYDIIFDTDTDKEANFLEAVRERYVQSSGTRVLEPACGSGRLTAELAARGYDTAGFDASDAMLDFARQRYQQRGVDGMLKRAMFHDFSFDKTRFDLAFCLVSSFKYVLDESEARQHLRRVADHLKPGGVYVLGVHICDYDHDGEQRERWVADRDGIHVVCNIKSWPPDRRTRTERVRSRIVATADGTTRRYESNWDFRTYSVGQLKALVRTEPRLNLQAVHTFHHDIDEKVDLDGERADYVLILRRG